MKGAWLGMLAFGIALSGTAVAEEDTGPAGHEMFHGIAFRQWWGAGRERADRNGDGVIDEQERAAFRRRMAERRHRLRQMLVNRFDANNDGRLEGPELRRLHEALARHPAFRDRIEDLRDRAEDVRDRREDVRDRREDRRDRAEDVVDRRDGRTWWFFWRRRPGMRDRAEDVRDRREDMRDRREDVRDHREDIRDRREDIRDAQHDGGRRDRLEDYLDRLEDVRDRREDVRDRREDVRDRREDVRDRQRRPGPRTRPRARRR